jgi:uncharacterized membrane protein YeaQ/YmgE (transglycosylase-associated protein family)
VFEVSGMDNVNNLMDYGGGVGWFWFLVIGGLAGWIAEKVMKTDQGLIMNIITGIIGSIIGGWIVKQLNLDLGDNWFVTNLIISAAGAIILIFVLRLVRGKRAPQ